MDMSFSIGNILTIVSVVVGIAVAWGAVSTRVETNSKRIEVLERLQAGSELCQRQMDVKLARIETDVQWIRASLGGKGHPPSDAGLARIGD